MKIASEGMVPPDRSENLWAKAAWEIGGQVAGPSADEVDRDARLPSEAIAAMRERGLLTMLLDSEVGGKSANVADAVQVTRALAHHCASTALVYAMHSIEAYNLQRHGSSNGLKDLAREIASKNLLISSATSEVAVGGDVSRSIAAVDFSKSSPMVEKECLAISYGEASDLIFASFRRDANAAETDQVYVALRRAECVLEPLDQWDTLGLRGTCSAGYKLKGPVNPHYIFPVSFAVIANDGGGQVRQLLLSAVWVGLADSALARAHSFVRAAARKAVGTVPPGALRVAEIACRVESARALLASEVARFIALEASSRLENMSFQSSLRSLKISTSRSAVDSATMALEVCGIHGYKRDSPFSLDRIVRDAHGGPIMVSNDRYLADNARSLLVTKDL